MARTIDTEALKDAKSLDISNPPTKEIPRQEFPKMIYKHPKDKTKEHKHKVVQNKGELDTALKAGWTMKPHVAEATPVEEEE